MKIYTKTGDAGETGLMGGKRVSKDSPYLAAYGTLDELNSALGIVLTHLNEEVNCEQEIKHVVEKIQHELFVLGAELAATIDKPVSVPRVTPQHVAGLEKYIDLLEAQLRIPQSFILPGGTRASAFIHLARTIARRAEREIVTLNRDVPLNPDILRYVNRLSDLLYVLARYANKETEVKEQQPIYRYFE